MTRFFAVMPVLRVTDLQRSIDWCQGVLGFEPHGRAVDDWGGEYCFVRAGDAEVLLSTGSHLGGRRRSPGRCTSESAGWTPCMPRSAAGPRSCGRWGGRSTAPASSASATRTGTCWRSPSRD